MTTDTLSVLGRLVGFDTTSSNGNRALIDWVAGSLATAGIDSVVLPHEDGTRANLIARVGPDEPGGIVLCGHTDAVPAEPSFWHSDPFRLRVDGGRAYGRGVVDMKGFVACAIAGILRLSTRELHRPIGLALTFDEELGCLGAAPLASALAKGPEPAVIVIGEPTGMTLVNAHKGIRVLRTVIEGIDAHSSQTDRGLSAIHVAAELVTFLGRVAHARQESGVRMAGFAPEHTTVNVGVISGGTAMNIVPRSCTIDWEYRTVPGDAVDSVQDEFEAMSKALSNADGVRITTSVIADVPPLANAPESLAVRLISDVARPQDGLPVSYGTDGGILAAAGFPCVVIGPGNPDQMHQPNEHIDIEQLEACDRFIDAVGDWAIGDIRT